MAADMGNKTFQFMPLHERQRLVEVGSVEAVLFQFMPLHERQPR